MICKKCQKEIANNYTGKTCPHCSAPLNKGYKNKFVSSSNIASAGTTVAKSSKMNVKKKTDKKVYKSKFVKSDQVESAGTKVAKASFIGLTKTKPKKEKDIELKNFNSYIDYKTAKENSESAKNSKYYNVYSKDASVDATGAKSSKAKYVRKEKKEKQSSTFRNTTTSSYREFPTVQGNNNAFSSGLNYPQFNNQSISQQPQYNYDNSVVKQVESRPAKNGNKLFAGFCFVAVLIVCAIFIFKNYAGTDYYFGRDVTNFKQGGNANVALENDDMLQYEGVSKSGQTGKNSGIGVTSIIYDRQYFDQLTFNNLNDVLKLIASDSNRQKVNCLPNVVAIEKEITSNYGITAINFCEMDADLALELESVVSHIYNNYPSARNYLTNITLANVEKVTYIAAFMPVFTFGTSKTNTSYPIAIKSQIILNAKYFLDTRKLNNTVKKGVDAGYFPPNTTRSSTIAHEFGHYLAFVALCNHYKSGRLNFVQAGDSDKLFTIYEDFNVGKFSLKMLQEAYNKYRSTYGDNLSFDRFRESISGYAMAKDKSGNYIYDETIAEAFHDVYLNGELAQPASRVIVEVLKSYL